MTSVRAGGAQHLPFARPDVTDDEVSAVVAAIRSGWLTTGPNAAAFEAEFGAFLGGGVHAVAVNSATAGLHLAVEALGIGPGDEVLLPTWTFTATAEVLRYVGATPVFVDVLPDTLNIDYRQASSLVTAKTVAVMPVHFAGHPVPARATTSFATAHGLAVIEDAAHAFPVREAGRYVGDSESEATVFSFYATKTITTGEGGMLVTHDADIAARARTMRLHGISSDVFDRYTSSRGAWEYDVVAPGFKYNMTDTAAALGRSQLRRAVQMRDRRSKIAERYDVELAGMPIELPAGVTEAEGHARHLYVIRLTDAAPVSRDDFIQSMSAAGIGTSVHFKPLHLHSYWRKACHLHAEAFPVATAEFDRVVSLPLFSSMTDENVDQVVRAVRGILASRIDARRREGFVAGSRGT